MARKGPTGRRRLWPALLRAGIVVTTVLVIIRTTGCMERLFYHPIADRMPVPAAFPDGESVTFASADGTRLHGWFLPARGVESPSDAATVIHVHGNAGNIDSHLGFTEFLPEAGFNLFIFDYRGYGQSAGSPWRRKRLIEDTGAALDAMLAREDVDPQRIGMFAQSLGGAMGLNVMAQREEIRAAVIMSSFTGWHDIAANALSGDPPAWHGRLVAMLLIRDHARPIEAIARIDRPLLIIHGDADRTIPVSHGRRLAAAAGENARYEEIPGGDHNDLRWTHPIVDDLTVEFLRESLAAAGD